MSGAGTRPCCATWRLASRSTRGRRPVLVEGATHQSIVTQEPYVRPVIEEILRIVALVG